MKTLLRKLNNSHVFHIVVILSIIFILSFITLLIILRYNVEGETNLPFNLSKISIISTSEGINKETTDTRWAFDISQNNDIYIQFDKNPDCSETEYIDSIIIENISTQSINNENIKIYKPDLDSTQLIFSNNEINLAQTLEYTGSTQNNFKSMELTTQGGTIAFRCSNSDIAEYLSNDEIINHAELLQKIGITNEQLKIDIQFDLILKLGNGNSYKTRIDLDLPINDIIASGTTSLEITDLDEIIFKKVTE